MYLVKQMCSRLENRKGRIEQRLTLSSSVGVIQIISVLLFPFMQGRIQDFRVGGGDYLYRKEFDDFFSNPNCFCIHCPGSGGGRSPPRPLDPPLHLCYLYHDISNININSNRLRTYRFLHKFRFHRVP